MVYRDPTGTWVIDSEDDPRPAEAAQVLTADGRAWTLHLPSPTDETVIRQDEALTPGKLPLRLTVSADRTQCEATVDLGLEERSVGPHAGNHLLLLLARAWIAAEREGRLHEAERGWLDQATVQEALELTSNALNVAVYRLRRQFEAIGVMDSNGVVERRTRPAQLRLGIVDLQLTEL